MTFTGIIESKRLIDHSQYFNMLECKNLLAMLPRSWKKSFNNRVITPVKMKPCDECKDGILCMTCIIRVDENKEFEANLNLLKRHTRNELGYMLPLFN